MSTAQLVVLWYAGLATVAVLLYSALTLDGSTGYLISAIGLLAGLLIYSLRPHPLARKWLVLAVVVLSLGIGSVSTYTWTRHTEREARLREIAAMEEAGKRAVEASNARMAEARAAREEEERVWLAGRLKVKERVSMADDGPRSAFPPTAIYRSEDSDGTVIFHSAPSVTGRKAGLRVYGRIVDVEVDPQRYRVERYAVKWDHGELTWVDGRNKLRRERPR